MKIVHHKAYKDKNNDACGGEGAYAHFLGIKNGFVIGSVKIQDRPGRRTFNASAMIPIARLPRSRPIT